MAPATSAKVTLFFVSFGSINFALELPNEKACIAPPPPAPPLAPLVNNQIKTPRIINIGINGAIAPRTSFSPVGLTVSISTIFNFVGVTPRFESVSVKDESLSFLATFSVPSFKITFKSFPSISTFSTASEFMLDATSERVILLSFSPESCGDKTKVKSTIIKTTVKMCLKISCFGSFFLFFFLPFKGFKFFKGFFFFSIVE